MLNSLRRGAAYAFESLLPSLACERQSNLNFQTTRRAVPAADAALASFDAIPYDRQSEAHATRLPLAREFRTVERLEYPVEFAFGQTRSVVGNGYGDMAIAIFRPDCDRPESARISNRISNHVRKRTEQILGIC
jgi:hypothetical protein